MKLTGQKFINYRREERTKAQIVEEEQNRRICRMQLGYDTVAQVDRDHDIVVFDPTIGARSFASDGTVLFCDSLFDGDDQISEEYRR